MPDHDHPYRQAAPQPLQRPPKTSALAIVAFVLACLFFIPLAPLIGGILGIAATVRVASRRDRLGGMGLAVAAIPVGFACFLFLQGILAAVAIPSFIRYVRVSKAAEAREVLDQVRRGATEFIHSERYDDAGTLQPRRFPAGNTGWVPALPCCQHAAGSACRATSGSGDWDGDPWRALGFRREGRHYYQVRYASSGEGATARFEVEARADLDCDGTYSSYMLTGWIDADGNVKTRQRIRDRLE